MYAPNLGPDRSIRAFLFGLPIDYSPRTVTPSRIHCSFVIFAFVIVVFVNLHFPGHGLVCVSAVISSTFRHGWQVLGLWRRLLMHRRQCWCMMGRFRRVIILIGPPLFFMTSLRRRVSVSYARRRLSTTRGIGSRSRRRLSIWG